MEVWLPCWRATPSLPWVRAAPSPSGITKLLLTITRTPPHWRCSGRRKKTLWVSLPLCTGMLKYTKVCYLFILLLLCSCKTPHHFNAENFIPCVCVLSIPQINGLPAEQLYFASTSDSPLEWTKEVIKLGGKREFTLHFKAMHGSGLVSVWTASDSCVVVTVITPAPSLSYTHMMYAYIFSLSLSRTSQKTHVVRQSRSSGNTLKNIFLVCHGNEN